MQRPSHYTPGEIIARREEARKASEKTRANLRTYLTVLAQRLQEHRELLEDIAGADRASTDDVLGLCNELAVSEHLLRRTTAYVAETFVQAHSDHVFFDTLAATVHIDGVA